MMVDDIQFIDRTANRSQPPVSFITLDTAKECLMNILTIYLGTQKLIWPM